MSMLPMFYNQWGYWELFNKVTFDGPNKLIYIVDEVTELDVKRDIYSAWKEWVLVNGHINSKFEPAIRGTGGDPLGGRRVERDHREDEDGAYSQTDRR